MKLKFILILMSLLILEIATFSQSLEGVWKRKSDNLKYIYYVLSMDNGNFTFTTKSTVNTKESVCEGTYKVEGDSIIVGLMWFNFIVKIIKLDNDNLSVTFKKNKYHFTKVKANKKTG